jgi:hypothetical protein
MQNLFEKTIDEIAKQKAKYIKESLQKKTKVDEGLKKYRIKAVNNLKNPNKEIDYTKVFSKNSIPRKTKAAEIRFQRMEAARKKAEKLLKKEKNLKLLKKAGKTGLKIAAVTAAAYGAKKLYDKYKKKKLNESNLFEGKRAKKKLEARTKLIKDTVDNHYSDTIKKSVIAKEKAFKYQAVANTARSASNNTEIPKEARQKLLKYANQTKERATKFENKAADSRSRSIKAAQKFHDRKLAREKLKRNKKIKIGAAALAATGAAIAIKKHSDKKKKQEERRRLKAIYYRRRSDSK